MSAIACLAKAWARQTSHSDSLHGEGQAGVFMQGYSSEELNGPRRRIKGRAGIPAGEFAWPAHVCWERGGQAAGPSGHL